MPLLLFLNRQSQKHATYWFIAMPDIHRKGCLKILAGQPFLIVYHRGRFRISHCLTFALFILQRLCRVDICCFYYLKTNADQTDQKDYRYGNNKKPGPQRNLVSIIFQPLTKDIICKGQTNAKTDQIQF